MSDSSAESAVDGDGFPPATEVCGGQYTLIDELSRSDLSIVYRAKPLGSSDLVAFKIIRSAHSEDQSQIRRFRRETELLRRIEHPNVVRVVDQGTIEDGRDFVAMELLVGQTLREALACAKRMSPERTCRIIRQVARAIRVMHNEGIVHRDLRPKHIILIGPADGERIKLVDFSAAGDVSAPAPRSSPPSHEDSAAHSSSYQPPEQRRKRSPQPTMDVYALGVIMFEMLAGEHPFVEPKNRLGPTIRSKAFDAPEVLLGLVADCIEKEPRKRPPSMDDVLERIDKALLWIGVVPHQVTAHDNDEDQRTQPYMVADPGRVPPPSPETPQPPTPAAPKEPRQGTTQAGEVILDPSATSDDQAVPQERRRRWAQAPVEDEESDRIPTQRRRIIEKPPTAPPTYTKRPRSARARTIPRWEEFGYDSQSGSRDSESDSQDSADSWDERSAPPTADRCGTTSEPGSHSSRTGQRRRTYPQNHERNRRITYDQRTTEPSVDHDEPREGGAPQSPRFVVDTVAWTKQHPSAHPGTGRRRTVKGGNVVERPSGRSPRQSSKSPSRTAVHATVNPSQLLPRWVLPLLVLVILVLAYAVWVVWTQ